MASSGSLLTFLTLYLFHILQTAYAYYCDNDKCLEEEFCCGENICCVSYKVWELWYFWCGILFCLLLLSLCGCFWRQRSRAYWVFRAPAPYSSLSIEEDTKYSPCRDDLYVDQSERSLSTGPFYGPAKSQKAWFGQTIEPKVLSQQYTDTEPYYDDVLKKKSEY